MKRLLSISYRNYAQVNGNKKIVMSGIQPTGIPHVGNYFGAIHQWIKLQSSDDVDHIYLSIVDLHAMTPFNKPIDIKENVYQMAATLISCGLTGKHVSLFQQSKIPHHSYLSWILMCICPLSRVSSLPQWKEKLEIWPGDELPNTALMMYPILQAADILLYTPDLVPVGQDQIIHLNLTRYLRTKLLHWHGDQTESKITDIEKHLTVPNILNCQFPKIFSLQQACKKMSKSDPNADSRIELTDSADQIKNKIRKGLTDSISKKITYDTDNRPELANLINIFCALKDLTPESAITQISDMSKLQFKNMLAEELIKTIDPIRVQIEYLLRNRDEIDRVLKRGHHAALEKADKTMSLISKHIGLKASTLDLQSLSDRINALN